MRFFMGFAGAAVVLLAIGCVQDGFSAGAICTAYTRSCPPGQNCHAAVDGSLRCRVTVAGEPDSRPKGGECDPLHPNQCVGGDTCTINVPLGETQCRGTGDIEEGEPCEGLDGCISGLSCHNVSDRERCWRFCDATMSTCENGDVCVPLLTSYGVCAGTSAGGECNPTIFEDCVGGSTCRVNVSLGEAECRSVGEVNLGDPCASIDDCVAGLGCHNISDQARCWFYCDATSATCDVDNRECVPVGVGYGVCREPPQD